MNYLDLSEPEALLDDTPTFWVFALLLIVLSSPFLALSNLFHK